MTWHAVDAAGLDLATGRPPRWPGHPAPAAALAAAPVATWPLSVVADDGRRLRLGAVLGAGGARVQGLLDALGGDGAGGPPVDVEDLARRTPAGPVDLPLHVVGPGEAAEATGKVDPGWLSRVEGERDALRSAAVAAGREPDLEAAVHVAVLVATERFDPARDDDVEAHVASGARLWLLAGAVAAAVAGVEPDPFEPWMRLVAAGWWPVGPAGGRLVVAAPAGRP